MIDRQFEEIEIVGINQMIVQEIIGFLLFEHGNGVAHLGIKRWMTGINRAALLA